MSVNIRREAKRQLAKYCVGEEAVCLNGIGLAILDLADAIRESNEHKDSNIPERVRK